MSVRVYRLLRNNKEEGPFTSEELIQKKLRPYDLIWVDGSSAAWRYPGEIAQFKQYAPLPAEENGLLQTNNSTVISPSIQAAIAVNNNLAAAGINAKPRYKVSAAWNKIQSITAQVNNTKPDTEKKSPVKKNMVASEATGIPTKSLSWEEAWLDWEKEKKYDDDITQATLQKPSGVSKHPTAKKGKSAPVLETKYSASLDTLKDQYIENIVLQKQQKKRSTRRTPEFLLPALALIVIFSVTFWFLQNTDAPGIVATPPKQPPSANNSNATKPDKGSEEKIEQPVSQPETNVATLTNKKNIEGAAERKMPASITRHIVHTNKPVSSNNISTASNLPASKQDIQKLADEINKTQNYINALSKNANKTTPVENKAPVTNTNTGNVATTPVENNEPAKPEINNKKFVADYIKVPDHIEMNNGSATIKIENISDIDIDLVVVDVQYFTTSNRFSKGETFYLHNLKAGRDVVIKTPKDESSVYATSKVSLISSDTKQVYIVGDN